MDKLRQLQQRFNALVGQLRAAQGEENPDASKIASIEAEIRGLALQIKTEEAIIEREGIDPEKRYSENAPIGEQSREETRSGVIAYMRTGDRSELRAMTSGTSGGGDTGGYLIPQSWENQILERERDLFVMRQLADVQISATDRNIPVADDYGESGWIEEGGQYPESDAKFAGKLMKAYKVGRICKVSEELLQDNDYNLESWITGAFGYSNGLAMELSYIEGDGNGKPTGFLVDADTVDAGGSAIAYGDMLNLFKALKSGYYRGANWLMNVNTLTAIMKLKDDSGAFLYKPFEPKNATGPLGQVLGRPVVLSSYMPDIAAGKKPVAFGDFKKYRIHDRSGFGIMRLTEKYADTGFIGFRGMQRTDGRLLVSEAVKALEF